MFRSLTYFSTGARLFSSKELVLLLEQSRAANARFGITGILLYKLGSFIQAIEGPVEAMDQLYINICGDPRHRGIIKVLDDTIQEREFSAWSMGFHDISEMKEHHVPDFTDFLKSEEKAKEFHANPSVAKKMLLSFR